MARRFGLPIIASVTMLLVPLLVIGLGLVSVKADIGSTTWLGAVYRGYDPTLGSYVQAFEVGSTATLMIAMRNDEDNPLEIKRVKVKFDWDGGVYEAQPGDYPAMLNQGSSGTAKISFTVPSEDVASNFMTHHYQLSVYCAGGYEIGGEVRGMLLGTGDGLQTEFRLTDCYVHPSTLRVYLDGVVTTHYTLLPWEGYYTYTRILFDTAPASGSSIVADCQRTVYVGVGNGYQIEFGMHNVAQQGYLYPIAPDSEDIYVGDTRCTGYTLDYDVGTVKFTNPPAPGAGIYASYDHYLRWFYAGNDFAVYTSEQVAAIDDGDSGHPEPTGTSWLGIGILAGVGLAALGVVLYVVLRRKGPSGA